MPKFIVRDRMACWVTWSYEIEAEDEDAAIDRYLQGDHPEAIAHEIGDGVEFLDNEVRAVEAEHARETRGRLYRGD